MLKSALTAALTYSALVFAAGFVLGTFRVLVVAPRLGAPLAVLVEAPVMLAISWLACGTCIRVFRLPPDVAAGLVMGAAALVLLLAAEMVLAALAFGRTPADYVRDLGTAAGAEGLAAQIAFALFPAVQGRQTT
jgi:hypothetical protein